MKAAYKRVVIKISGEALAAEKKTGFDFDFITGVCTAVKAAADAGVQVGIVIGGGNFWRGVKDGAGKVERVSADRMGMLATCMNCLAVCDVLRQLGAKARVMTAVDIMGVGERYDTRRAIEYLEAGEIVLFAGGSGAPFFSTDTAAALRAAEIGADALLLAKNVDAVYSADPKKDPNAVRYSHLSYEKVIRDNLKATDLTAITLCREQELPILCFALDRLEEAVECENVGTLIDSRE